MSTKETRATLLIYRAALVTPLGEAHVFGTDVGLLAIALPRESANATIAAHTRRLGPLNLVTDEGGLGPALTQLAEYFAGERRDFDLPLDLRGTPFQCAVWRASYAIPYGETRRYGEIAALLNSPGAARAVGAANAANPLPPIIPCHRLIGADGALRGHRSGLATKRWLLDHERGTTTTAIQAPPAAAQRA
jgi:methylated-DNA-[protein]-cysteine S-methyltransferase